MDRGNDESVVLYTTPDGAVKVNAVIKNETLWLTQAAMAELFGVGSQAITKHLKNIYAEGELSLEATCSKMEQVQSEGKRQVSREVSFYNLDAIIAVGYRVNSARATHFRIWVTGVLREYIIKGFALDDNRLKKGGNPFGKDYFDYIERIIERHQTFTMKEFAASVNKFLEFNEYRVLEGPGKVPRAVADEKAGKEYDIFNKHQPIISDFDQEIKRLLGKDEK